VTIEHLDPFLAAAVDATGQVYARTRLRYDRTMQYFALVAFGDAKSVLDASEILVKIHSKAVGTEPITRRPFDANDPHSQLWIHLTAWHSMLYTYEMFGPGKLTEAEERQYWEECARAAEFQTINPDDVPRTREGIREYFENFRPDLVGSEVAQRMMDYLVDLGYHILPSSCRTGCARRSTSRCVPRSSPPCRGGCGCWAASRRTAAQTWRPAWWYAPS
jgi:uncharacterized protein (DUF2236 family)